MKLTITVTIEVKNDWDGPLFSDGGVGRKQVVTGKLRRALMESMMRHAAPLLTENGIEIESLAISEPTWEGWDNAAIAEALATNE